jgi:hypothetical protein
MEPVPAQPLLTAEQLIQSYTFMHLQSPTNVDPLDYRTYNAMLLRAVKVNALFTLGTTMVGYKVLKYFVRPVTALGVS